MRGDVHNTNVSRDVSVGDVVCGFADKILEVLPRSVFRESNNSHAVVAPARSTAWAASRVVPAAVGMLDSKSVPAQSCPVQLVHSIFGIARVLKFDKGEGSTTLGAFDEDVTDTPEFVEEIVKITLVSAVTDVANVQSC